MQPVAAAFRFRETRLFSFLHQEFSTMTSPVQPQPDHPLRRLLRLWAKAVAERLRAKQTRRNNSKPERADKT